MKIGDIFAHIYFTYIKIFISFQIYLRQILFPSFVSSWTFYQPHVIFVMSYFFSEPAHSKLISLALYNESSLTWRAVTDSGYRQPPSSSPKPTALIAINITSRTSSLQLNWNCLMAPWNWRNTNICPDMTNEWDEISPWFSPAPSSNLSNQHTPINSHRRNV